MSERLTVRFSERGGLNRLPCGWHGQRKVIPWIDATPQPKLGETWVVEVMTSWDSGELLHKHKSGGEIIRYGACYYVRPLKLLKAAE